MDNFFEFYDIEPDAKHAAWVVERCIGPKHTLHTIVPSGFASYVRICHPGWSFDALDPNDDEDEKAPDLSQSGFKLAVDQRPRGPRNQLISHESISEHCSFSQL